MIKTELFTAIFGALERSDANISHTLSDGNTFWLAHTLVSLRGHRLCGTAYLI